MSFSFFSSFSSLSENQKPKKQNPPPYALVSRGRARHLQGVALEADLGAIVEALKREEKNREEKKREEKRREEEVEFFLELS